MRFEAVYQKFLRVQKLDELGQFEDELSNIDGFTIGFLIVIHCINSNILYTDIMFWKVGHFLIVKTCTIATAFPEEVPGAPTPSTLPAWPYLEVPSGRPAAIAPWAEKKKSAPGPARNFCTNQG